MWFPKIPQYTTLFTVYDRNVKKISGQWVIEWHSINRFIKSL